MNNSPVHCAAEPDVIETHSLVMAALILPEKKMGNTPDAKKTWDKMIRKYAIENATIEPIVTMVANDNCHWGKSVLMQLLKFKPPSIVYVTLLRHQCSCSSADTGRDCDTLSPRLVFGARFSPSERPTSASISLCRFSISLIIHFYGFVWDAGLLYNHITTFSTSKLHLPVESKFIRSVKVHHRTGLWN